MHTAAATLATLLALIATCDVCAVPVPSSAANAELRCSTGGMHACAATAAGPHRYSCERGSRTPATQLEFQDDVDEWCHSCPVGVTCVFVDCIAAAQKLRVCLAGPAATGNRVTSPLIQGAGLGLLQPYARRVCV